MRIPRPGDKPGFVLRTAVFLQPRSQVALGNALAEAISLPILTRLSQADWREMEFREEQEAFPSATWE
jgi:hypothetical protein